MFQFQIYCFSFYQSIQRKILYSSQINSINVLHYFLPCAMSFASFLILSLLFILLTLLSYFISATFFQTIPRVHTHTSGLICTQPRKPLSLFVFHWEHFVLIKKTDISLFLLVCRCSFFFLGVLIFLFLILC